MSEPAPGRIAGLRCGLCTTARPAAAAVPTASPRPCPAARRAAVPGRALATGLVRAHDVDRHGAHGRGGHNHLGVAGLASRSSCMSASSPVHRRVRARLARRAGRRRRRGTGGERAPAREAHLDGCRPCRRGAARAARARRALRLGVLEAAALDGALGVRVARRDEQRLHAPVLVRRVAVALDRELREPADLELRLGLLGRVRAAHVADRLALELEQLVRDAHVPEERARGRVVLLLPEQRGVDAVDALAVAAAAAGSPFAARAASAAAARRPVGLVGLELGRRSRRRAGTRARTPSARWPRPRRAASRRARACTSSSRSSCARGSARLGRAARPARRARRRPRRPRPRPRRRRSASRASRPQPAAAAAAAGGGGGLSAFLRRPPPAAAPPRARSADLGRVGGELGRPRGDDVAVRGRGPGLAALCRPAAARRPTRSPPRSVTRSVCTPRRAQARASCR